MVKFSSILPYQVIPLRARVDLRAIAMKGYSAIPKASALLKPDHQNVKSLTPLQRSSLCILLLGIQASINFRGYLSHPRRTTEVLRKSTGVLRKSKLGASGRSYLFQ